MAVTCSGFTADRLDLANSRASRRRRPDNPLVPPAADSIIPRSTVAR
jgi:hypothetical protein